MQFPPSLSEQQRLAYLKALGVEAWVENKVVEEPPEQACKPTLVEVDENLSDQSAIKPVEQKSLVEVEQIAPSCWRTSRPWDPKRKANPRRSKDEESGNKSDPEEQQEEPKNGSAPKRERSTRDAATEAAEQPAKEEV